MKRLGLAVAALFVVAGAALITHRAFVVSKSDNEGVKVQADRPAKAAADQPEDETFNEFVREIEPNPIRREMVKTIHEGLEEPEDDPTPEIGIAGFSEDAVIGASFGGSSSAKSGNPDR